MHLAWYLTKKLDALHVMKTRSNRWPVAKEQILPIIFISLISLTAYLFEASLIQDLVYHRDAISDGEFYRFLSGHFFHTNLNHLLLNLAGLLLLWSLHGQYYRWPQYPIFFITNSLIVSFGLYFFSPELSQYVGLSGVLHGYFLWGALQDIKHKLKSGYLLLAGIVVKIAHEQVYGASDDISQLINANVAIDAHLWGAIAGALFFLLTYLLNKIKKPASS